MDDWDFISPLLSPTMSLLTFQSFSSRTSEFVFKSCPKGKESDSFLLLEFLLFQLTFFPLPAIALKFLWLFDHSIKEILWEQSVLSFFFKTLWVKCQCLSASNKARSLWGGRQAVEFLSFGVLNFFLSLFMASISFLFLVLDRKDYPLALITFVGSLCEV